MNNSLSQIVCQKFNVYVDKNKVPANKETQRQPNNMKEGRQQIWRKGAKL